MVIEAREVLRRPERFNKETDLSAVEYVLLGGTVYMNGILNSNTLLELVEREVDYPEVFEPLGVSKGLSVDEINVRREEKGFYAGAMGFVKPEAQIDLLQERNALPQLYLTESNIDTKNPAYKLGLGDRQGKLSLSDVESFRFYKKNLIDRWKLSFDMQLKDDGVYMVKR